jgi:Fe2+ or Zn2+ uptake regulation protein
MRLKNIDRATNKNLIAENILTSTGYKITHPRKILIDLLSVANRPLRPAEICEIGQKHDLDRVSVYRVLEVLEKVGLIHVVGDLGYVFCSNINHFDKVNDQHLFLVCEICDSVEEAQLPVKIQNALQSYILSESKFKFNGAAQISGCCSKCSA